jgi:ubiquinone biosynthesis protein
MNRKNENERMREIISVFLNHGIKKGVMSKNMSVSIRESFEELGPTFIKIGQILSMRSDLIPATYINEFQKLQDSVKPEDYEIIRKVIEEELKKPVSDTFLKFETLSTASASLAQVHLAYLKEGTKVAVKVQRPGVNEKMMTDIAILKRLARRIKLAPQGDVLNFQEIAEELEDSAKKELDFLNEAKNIKKFYENNSGVNFIKCPVVYDKYTTSELLVMGYIDGIKISDTEELEKEGYDINEIGLKLSNNYFKQIFEDGFFHADPHPGNIIIENNKIAYIDFGMMGTLSSSMKDKFNKLLYGLVTRDVDEMSQAVLKICIKKGEVDNKKFHNDIEQMYSKYIDTTLQEVDLNSLINDLQKVLRKNHLSMPREITLLLKGVLTIEGLLEKLAPEINIIDMALPYVKRHMLNGVDIKKDIMGQLQSFYILSRSSPKIMENFVHFINNALTGKLKVQMEYKNSENIISQLNRMVNRIVFGIIVAALIIGSSLIVNTETGTKINGISAIGLIGYIGAFITGLYLLISIIRSGKM